MFSFSSALWLAAASAMITAEVSAAYYPVATCESNGLEFRCAHRVICEDHPRARLECDFGDVINVHRVNYGQLDDTNRFLKDPCHSTIATYGATELYNGKNKWDVHFADLYSMGDDCSVSECLEVYYFCGPLTKVCEKSGANIRCDAGEVIRIQRAHYDQHYKSVCSASQTNYQDCTPPKPSLEVAKMCDGKSSCTIRADSDVFVNPCKETDKSLALSYICIETL